MQISGWGRYPRREAVVVPISSPLNAVASIAGRSVGFIPRGLGRSYGDSAMAAVALSSTSLDHFIDFDTTEGVVTCQAGVCLADILRVCMPAGWFVPVTPGTKHVTVGGAIASDVHGKNHHRDGTFTRHVLSMTLLLGNGEILVLDPVRHADLFRATSGGMGLTGFILSASIKLRPIASSRIVRTTVRADCLESALEQFEINRGSAYSVAWIDCLVGGKHLGRSLLMLGEHAEKGGLKTREPKQINIPCDMPAWLLNEYFMKAFNRLYYAKSSFGTQSATVSHEAFFYPLDSLSNWNRMYGRNGFLQYQLVLPRSAGKPGLRQILERIIQSGKGSFLAVLKAFGEANDNPLSFPIDGYTLALDFQVERKVFELLDELDSIVLDHGGRLYLSKDARMSERTFKASYPKWSEFEAVRDKYHAIGKFSSLQSKRLGLL